MAAVPRSRVATALRPALAALTAAAVVIGSLLTGCQDKVQRPPCPAGKVCLEYGNNSEPLTLDPQKSNLIDEFTIIADLIVGMTTDAPDARPVPGMATSWETSPDGLVWTFHMRDAAWSDGVPVTADDFVYAYRRILAPETASIYAYLVYILKNGQAVNEGKAKPETLGVRALDPHTPAAHPGTPRALPAGADEASELLPGAQARDREVRRQTG